MSDNQNNDQNDETNTRTRNIESDERDGGESPYRAGANGGPDTNGEEELLNTEDEKELLESARFGAVVVEAVHFQVLMGLNFAFVAGEDVSGPPSYGPGPVAAAEGGLLSRRLANPLARLYYAATMAELGVLPFYIAKDAAERDWMNEEIGFILALSRAVDAGLFRGWCVCWPPGRFPKMPTSVRLLGHPGQGGKERALGEVAGPLRRFVDAVKATNALHAP